MVESFIPFERLKLKCLDSHILLPEGIKLCAAAQELVKLLYELEDKRRGIDKNSFMNTGVHVFILVLDALYDN